MKIVVGFPPNIKEIQKAFKISENTIFTYGDTMYVQKNDPVTIDLLIHEQTHERQQGKNPKAWWKKYISDPTFRLVQEIEAYRNQYAAYCSKFKDRNVRVRFLFKIASDLSGSLYGNITDFATAKEIISKGIK